LDIYKQNLINNLKCSDLTNLKNYEMVGGKNKKWKNSTQKRSKLYVKHPKPTNGAGMVTKTYENNKQLDIERLNNPYLLHPEDYETQQELFDAIKHWWIFKYRKKESTIIDRLRYAKKMSEHNVFPINWLKFNPVQIINYLEHREYVDYQNKRGKHQIINEWKTVKTFAKAY